VYRLRWLIVREARGVIWYDVIFDLPPPLFAAILTVRL
jgi:hypothetical protein